MPTRSSTALQISDGAFDIEDNEDAGRSVRFDFTSDRCIFSLCDDRGDHKIAVGLRDWLEGQTSMTGNRLHHQYQPDSLLVVAGGRWLDERTFEMIWQFVETAFQDRVMCRFDGEILTLDRSVNVNAGAIRRPTLRGKLSQRIEPTKNEMVIRSR